jgi:hypothetical protein
VRAWAADRTSSPRPASQRDNRDRMRVGGVGLASLTGGEHSRPLQQFRRHVHHRLPVGDQAPGDVPADAVAALDRLRPVRMPASRGQHQVVATLIGAEPARIENRSPVVDDFDGCRALVRIHSDCHSARAPPRRACGDHGISLFSASDEAAARTALEGAGIDFTKRPALQVTCLDRPGEAGEIGRMLADDSVNVEGCSRSRSAKARSSLPWTSSSTSPGQHSATESSGDLSPECSGHVWRPYGRHTPVDPEATASASACVGAGESASRDRQLVDASQRLVRVYSAG